ncbi:hypothetical protein DPMN_072809 [Dreissena polymorpha]|uniref:Uncharacterized protein n=1 Tax=Dreissena polymorpha TaxID=45954 RepID=A0A9D4BXY6_DREPO|nr:hypothetical protein DPMN_072809 [Dreissena polymorpha]
MWLSASILVLLLSSALQLPTPGSSHVYPTTIPFIPDGANANHNFRPFSPAWQSVNQESVWELGRTPINIQK